MQIVRTNYLLQQVASSLSKPKLGASYLFTMQMGCGYTGHTSIAFPDAAELEISLSLGIIGNGWNCRSSMEKLEHSGRSIQSKA